MIEAELGDSLITVDRRTREAREAEEAAKRAENQGPIAGYGEIGNGRSRPNYVRSTRWGNDSTYLARRILRKAPRIHERMLAGELSIVGTAAIECGVIKQPTGLEQLS